MTTVESQDHGPSRPRPRLSKFSLKTFRDQDSSLENSKPAFCTLKTTSGFNSDHTIRQYAHGLLLESAFVPSSTDC